MKPCSVQFFLRQLPLLVLLLLLGNCANPAITPSLPIAATPINMTISSPAFASGQPIPEVYTCKGDDVSPPLEWTSPPPGSASLALIMDDPDAPAGTWVHWVVYNIPPETTSLPDGKNGPVLPPQAVSGMTSFRRATYGGPCPPSGEHRYFFHLYALDITLPVDNLDKSGLLKAIDGHILAQGEFYGTFQK